MKTKMILVLALCTVLFASLVVQTGAGYTTATSFAATISPDMQKIKK